VTRVADFGCFVHISGVNSRDGLVHISQYARTGDHSDPRAGDSVWVKVLAIKESEDDRQPRIQLTMDCVDQKTGKDLDPRNRRDENPELFSIHSGVVTSVKPFGAFVRLDGFRHKEGLVHVSQFADHKVDSAEEFLGVGDKVGARTQRRGRTNVCVLTSLSSLCPRARPGTGVRQGNQCRGTRGQWENKSQHEVRVSCLPSDDL
jgi:predicted RNA-binding protein with RPS1 domain